MTIRRLIEFLAGVAVTALIGHMLVAFVAAAAIHRLFPHRIYNARVWSDTGNERFHLVGTFLVENAPPSAAPVIAFAGSSVTYGYPWDERLIFSRLFAEKKDTSKVINASIIATDVTGINDWIVCGAWRNRIQLDVAVIEIPVVNTTSHLIQARKDGRHAGIGACEPGAGDPGYFRLAAMRPRGIGWFRFLSNTEARETEEMPVQIVPVPKGYFASAADFAAIREDYVGRIRTLLGNAQQVARTVYAFPSPVFVGGLAEIGEDANAVREQLQTAVDACASVPGVRCLDTADLWQRRSYYFNLTHLNQTGHRALADFLAQAIDAPSQRATR